MDMYDVKESDWKLLRKFVPDWQERYMDKLNKEYIEILSRECNPSTNLQELKKRIDDEVYAKEIILEVKNQ